MIESPAETALLRAARERGLAAHPGEPMLAHRIDAYLDFFGLWPADRPGPREPGGPCGRLPVHGV
ncbi:hypothetical protein [Micromonospora chersina]|uniref:hypothetical protein n=1 Tax=Micromonospora chersina TaxID=47854 RepID=UPI0033A2EAE5